MESARKTLKIVVVPLVIACLIPVVYRRGLALLTTKDASVSKALKSLDKRLTQLERELHASAKHASDIEIDYQTLEQRLHSIESILGKANTESPTSYEQLMKSTGKRKSQVVDSQGNTGSYCSMALSALQIVFILCNIVLLVKLKRVSDSADVNSVVSPASSERTPRKVEKA